MPNDPARAPIPKTALVTSWLFFTAAVALLLVAAYQQRSVAVPLTGSVVLGFLAVRNLQEYLRRKASREDPGRPMR